MVITDLVQFVIAMFGSITLAIIALNYVGGMESLLGKLSEYVGTDVVNKNTLKFIPPVPEAGVTTSTFWESPFSKFLIYISVMYGYTWFSIIDHLSIRHRDGGAKA